MNKIKMEHPIVAWKGKYFVKHIIDMKQMLVFSTNPFAIDIIGSLAKPSRSDLHYYPVFYYL